MVGADIRTFYHTGSLRVNRRLTSFKGKSGSSSAGFYSNFKAVSSTNRLPISHNLPTCFLSLQRPVTCRSNVFTQALLTQLRHTNWFITCPAQTFLPHFACSGLSAYSTYIANTLLLVFMGLGSLLILKLKFKGKSFKWHRRASHLILRFGHSHLVGIRGWPGLRWRRKGKTKILIYGSNFSDLVLFSSKVVRWRPMNVYHGRGLRLSRQYVYRKFGKVSAYR